MKIKRVKASQKIRLIHGGVCFYTTAKQIRYGVGAFAKFNAATQKALDALEFVRSGTGAGDASTTGMLGTWEGLSIQIDLL